MKNLTGLSLLSIFIVRSQQIQGDFWVIRANNKTAEAIRLAHNQVVDLRFVADIHEKEKRPQQKANF